MPTTAEGSGAYDLADFGRASRRRAGWVVAGLVLGCLGGWLAQERAAPSYSAQSSVLVEAVGASETALAGGRTRSEINLDTEAQLVTSAEVAVTAGERLGSPLPPEELAESVQVSVPPNSQILVIAFEATTPGAAQSGAQAFADAYLENRATQSQAQVQPRLDALTTQIADLTLQVDELAARAGTLPEGSPDREVADAQRTLLTTQIATLSQRVQDLRDANGTPGRVVSAATLPTSPAGAGALLYLASGAALGLVLGIAVAYMRERTDGRVHDTQTVERDFGLTAMGSVPAPTDRSATSSSERRAYGRLRNLLLADTRHGHRIFLFTGAGAHVVRQVSNRLSLSLTDAGRSVVVVDAGPGTDAHLSEGLSDVLRDGAWPSSVTRHRVDGSAPLHIGPGLTPARLPELLARPGSGEVFRQLAAHYDVVLVVAPRATDPAAQTTATMVDGVVHVVRAGHASRSSLLAAVNAVAEIGGTTVGVLLVGRRRLADRLRLRAEPPESELKTYDPVPLPAIAPGDATPVVLAPLLAATPELVASTSRPEDAATVVQDAAADESVGETTVEQVERSADDVETTTEESSDASARTRVGASGPGG